jgi:RNA polymerase sigma-70 factor (ECF subfamily)
LNVFKHIDGFRGDCQFASWLTRITINQALMKIRGKAQKFVFLDEPMEAEDGIGIRELKSCGDTPEELYLHREFETVVLNLATTVRKSSQSVLGLHITTNLSEGEIAKALKLTLPAAKARLYRGRQDLQEKMGRYYPLLKPLRIRKIRSALITRTNICEDIHEKHFVLLPSTL